MRVLRNHEDLLAYASESSQIDRIRLNMPRKDEEIHWGYLVTFGDERFMLLKDGIYQVSKPGGTYLISEKDNLFGFKDASRIPNEEDVGYPYDCD